MGNIIRDTIRKIQSSRGLKEAQTNAPPAGYVSIPTTEGGVIVPEGSEVTKLGGSRGSFSGAGRTDQERDAIANQRVADKQQAQARAEAEAKRQEEQKTRADLANLSREFNKNIRDIKGVSGRTERLKQFNEDRSRITGGDIGTVAGGKGTSSAVYRDKSGEIIRTEQTVGGPGVSKTIIQKDIEKGTERIVTKGVGGGTTGISFAKEIKEEPKIEVKEIKSDKIVLPEYKSQFLGPTRSTRTDLQLRDIQSEKKTISQEIKQIAETKPVQMFIGATSAVAQAVGDVPLKMVGTGTETTLGEVGGVARDLFSTGIERGIEEVSYFGKKTGRVIKGEEKVVQYLKSFAPSKRPDVLLSLNEGVIRETTAEERKPVTYFDIEKTTPTTKATAKAAEFVSYFHPQLFIPLVVGDIAKSTQDIKRIEKRTDLTTEQRQELIKGAKTDIGLSSALLLGAGALKAKRILTAEKTTKVAEARVKQFRTQELTADGKNIFSRVTKVSPEKFETTSMFDKIIREKPKVTYGKKFGQIIVETPQEVTKVGKPFTLLTKRVSKATPERLSEEQIKLVLRDAKFQPTTKLTQVIPGQAKQVIKGDIVVSKAPVLSFEFGKAAGRKATIDLDRLRRTTKIDEITSIVKRQRQIIPERQVYTAGSIGQEVGIISGRKIGKPSREATTILEIIPTKESGIKSFQGGGKKSSPEYLQSLYEPPVQLPKSKVKLPKPSKQITEVVKDITPTISPKTSVRALPSIQQEQVVVTDLAPVTVDIGMKPQLEGPQLDIISDIKLDTQPKTDIKLIQQTKLKTQARSIIDIKPDVKIDAQADTKIDTKLQMKLKTKQQIKQITDSILQIKEKGKPKPPRPPRIKVPKIFEEDTMKSKVVKDAEKVLDIFKVFVTKKGKEVEIGEFGTIQKAKKALKTELTETLRAGGVIKKKGEKVKFELGVGFKKSKIDPFKVIELKQRRLKKGTQETKEIQYFRKQKRKGGFL